MALEDNNPQAQPPSGGPGTHPSASSYLPDLPLAEDLQAQLGSGYIVENFLGQGGMGAVYKGLQMPLRRAVAIKILQKRQAAGEEDAFAFEERFKREAYAMAALTHPHIVQVYDCGDAGENYLFISMELVEGGDLSDAIKAGQVTPEVALKLIPQICDGLQAAHDRGIVHRDIKPANIFLTKDGRAKVADFGLAKKFDVKNTLVTKAGLGMGTPDYAAPEQYDGVDIDHRADIYALGVMMYQMLTGRLPRGATFKMPSQLSGVDPRIDSIVQKAMESERDDRYQSTAEIKAALAQVKADGNGAPLPVTLTSAVPSIERPITGPRPVTGARPITGIRSATSTRTTQSVRRPASGVVTATPVAETEPKKKSSFALIGVIAAVVVIGLGAMFLLRKPAPPTSDTSSPGATAKSTPSPTGTSTQKTSPSPTPPPPVQWRSAFTKLDDFRGGRSGQAAAKDGWVMPSGIFGMSIISPNQPGPVKNAGMRARVRYQNPEIPGDVRFQFEMRIGTGHYYLAVTPTGKMKIGLYEKGAASQGIPSLVSDRAALNVGEEYVLEFFVIGTRLVARCDGQLLGTLTDARLISGEGKLRSSVPFRDVESINLDGLSEADALKIAGVDAQGRDTGTTTFASATSVAKGTPSSSSASPKIGVIDPGQWTRLGKDQVRMPAGEMQGDKILLPAESYAYLEVPNTKNAVVRVKVKRADSVPFGLRIVQRSDAQSIYAYAAVPTSSTAQGMIQVSPNANGADKTGRQAGCDSLAPGKESTFEFLAAGGQYVLNIDGKAVAMHRDDRPMQAGAMHLFSGRGAVEFRELEVMVLDGLSEDKYPGFVKDSLGKLRAASLASVQEIPAPNPSAGTATSPGSFPTGQWVKPIRKWEDLAEVHRKGGNVKLEDEWLKPTDAAKGFGFSIPGFKGANMAIRIVMRIPGANPGGGPVLQTRITANEGRYELMPSGGSLAISHLKEPTRTALAAGTRRLFITPDRDISIEMAVIGTRLYGRADGGLAVRATDSRLASGGIGIHSKSWIRDIEVINLDGVAEAEALRLIGVDEKGTDLLPPENEKFVPGQWTKVYTQADKLPPDLRLPTSGVTWDDGWIRYEKPMRLYLPSSLVGNYGVRARFARVDGKNTATLTLRNQSLTTTDHYKLFIGDGGRQFISYAIKGSETLPLFGSPILAPVKVDTEYTMEFGAVENRLVGRLNDSLVKMASDDRFNTGHAYITGSESTRDIEVINLNGLTEAEALRLLGVDEAGNDLRPQERQRMAQERMNEAIAAIPELKQLHAQFLTLQSERVTAPYEADLAKLNAGYLGGLDRALSDAKTAGRVDDAAAFEAEKQLITSRQPLPQLDDEKTGETLKKLRGIYRASRAPLEAQREASLKALTGPLQTRLAALATDFTAKGRETDAKVVQEFIASLTAGAPVVASAPVTGSKDGPAKSGSGAGTAPASEAPPRTFTPADPRAAAEWVFSLGGTVDIDDRGTRRTIRSLEELPKSRIEILKVWLDKGKALGSPTGTFTTLEPLAGLKKLIHLETHNYDVPDADADVLASLPALANCQINDARKFTGQRLGMLRGLDDLDMLHLGGSGITRAGLEAVATLKGFTRMDLSNTPLSDEDLAALAEMKNLRMLWIRSTKFSAAALGHLKKLDAMTEFGWRFQPGTVEGDAAVISQLFPRLVTLMMETARDIPGSEITSALAHFPNLEKVIFSNGPNVSDEQGRALAGVQTLKNIHYASAPLITDATFEVLASHKNVTSLRVDSAAGFTRAGLMALVRIKSLSRLEVRDCKEIDEAAFAEFKKQRPDVTLVK